MRTDAEYNAGSGGDISMWPGSIGLATTFDPALVGQFGENASREYRALGITTALSSQIDLATEPRWYRFNGPFGEDPDLATAMAWAYVDGFQSSSGIGGHYVRLRLHEVFVSRLMEKRPGSFDGESFWYSRARPGGLRTVTHDFGFANATI